MSNYGPPPKTPILLFRKFVRPFATPIDPRFFSYIITFGSNEQLLGDFEIFRIWVWPVEPAENGEIGNFGLFWVFFCSKTIKSGQNAPFFLAEKWL